MPSASKGFPQEKVTGVSNLIPGQKCGQSSSFPLGLSIAATNGKGWVGRLRRGQARTSSRFLLCSSLELCWQLKFHLRCLNWAKNWSCCLVERLWAGRGQSKHAVWHICLKENKGEGCRLFCRTNRQLQQVKQQAGDTAKGPEAQGTSLKGLWSAFSSKP